MTTTELLALIDKAESEAYDRNKTITDRLVKSAADVVVMRLVNNLKRLIKEQK